MPIFYCVIFHNYYKIKKPWLPYGAKEFSNDYVLSLSYHRNIVSKNAPRFLGHAHWHGSIQTRIMSSPMTSMFSQQIRISFSLPKNRPLPYMIIATTLPQQVSTSTSQTCPKRQPSFLLITSLHLKSVTQQITKITPASIICRRRFYHEQWVFIS